jgi:hypothetical protein
VPTASPSPRWPLPRFVQKGRAETVDCPLYDGRGQPVAVTAGTYSLLDPNGAAVIDAATATITAGVASYALGSTFADAYTLPQTPWRERWVLDGATFENEVHVCRVAPVQHVTAEDLFRLHPQWRMQLPRSRTSSTYDEPIAVAWEETIQRLIADGHLPQRVLNWWAVAVIHKYRAAALVCRDFTADNPNDNRWQALGLQYDARAEAEYTERLAFQADADEDGIAETPGLTEAAEPPLYLTDLPVPDWHWPGYTRRSW